MIKVCLHFLEDEWRSVEGLKILAAKAAQAAFDHADKRRFLAGCARAGIRNDGELTLVFSNDRHVQQLNRDFRGMDKPTNILSFPFDENDLDAGIPLESCHLGDVILAWQTVEREARCQKIPLRHHIAHLVVHGVLHLCGHDHHKEADAENMERLESDILSTFGIPCPYRIR